MKIILVINNYFFLTKKKAKKKRIYKKMIVVGNRATQEIFKASICNFLSLKNMKIRVHRNGRKNLP